jgi:hypothetical protein|tara:strand:+ start:1644 stop:2093 length:450 start_codon:yes stop_codon:yes gene_type:complete
MELNNELKLLLIKTEAHKDEAAATGVFNTIRDLEDIDETSAYEQRLELFYSKHRNLGATDSEGRWTEPTEAELTESLEANEYVTPVVAAIWQLEKYESEAAYNADQYARDRRVKYNLLNQDEMRFDDSVNGTTTWVDAILAIKAAHPKP